MARNTQFLGYCRPLPSSPGLHGLRRIDAVGIGNRQASPVQAANARDLFLGMRDRAALMVCLASNTAYTLSGLEGDLALEAEDDVCRLQVAS